MSSFVLLNSIRANRFGPFPRVEGGENKMKILIMYKTNDQLGHLVSELGVKLNQEKLNAIDDCEKLFHVGSGVFATHWGDEYSPQPWKGVEWDMILFHTSFLNYDEEGLTQELGERAAEQVVKAGLAPSKKIIPFSLGYSPWGQKLVKAAVAYGRGCKSERKARKKIKKIRKKYNLYLSS